MRKHIEHTLLKPEASVEAVMELCVQADEHNLYGVCVAPCYVALAKNLLRDKGTRIITVVGFPLGDTYSEVKALETKMAIDNHADEVDMVMNLAAFKTGNYAAVIEDIKAVVCAAAPYPVKVIIETCLLTDAEKRKACELVAAGGAKFVKTSTGFAKGGATIRDVMLLRAEADKFGLGVKAAGGIRDAVFAKALLEAGADRIGTSAGHLLVGESHD